MNVPPLLQLAIVVWALLLLGGQAVGKPAPDGSGSMPAWTRLASSATLAAAGWMWFASGLGQAVVLFLIAAGMSLGLVGDLFMTLRRPESTRPVAFAMVAFSLCQVAYSTAFLLTGQSLGLDASAMLLPWLAWLAAGAAAWYLAIFRGRKATALLWATLPYALLLANTGGLAAALALRSPHLWPLALGAGLFLVSDLIVACRIFAGTRFRNMQDVIWLTYGPAQALIVFGLHL